MDPILVRPAVEDDFVALRIVFRRASWSNEQDQPLLALHPEFLDLSPALRRNGRTLVATLDGRVVGFASVVDHGDVVELEDLFVDGPGANPAVSRLSAPHGTVSVTQRCPGYASSTRSNQSLLK